MKLDWRSLGYPKFWRASLPHEGSRLDILRTNNVYCIRWTIVRPGKIVSETIAETTALKEAKKLGEDWATRQFPLQALADVGRKE